MDCSEREAVVRWATNLCVMGKGEPFEHTTLEPFDIGYNTGVGVMFLNADARMSALDVQPGSMSACVLNESFIVNGSAIG